MRPRLKAFLLFLLFVVTAEVLGGVFNWIAFSKLKVVDTSDRSWRPSIFIWGESLSAVGSILAAWLIARIGHRRLGDVGYRRRNGVRDLALGSLYGFVAVALLVIGIAAFGGFSPGHLMMSGPRLATYVIAWLIAAFGIGLSEETEFRSAGLLALADAIGFWPAAIVISLIFSALHYFGKGPVENFADALSVGLLGLFMCFTVLRTGAIWFAVGFHALFDYAALYVFGAPNSGNQQGQPIATRLLTGGFHGPAWLTGGPLGVEASWLVFPIILGLFIVFHLLHRRPEAVAYNPPIPNSQLNSGGAA